MNKIQVRLGPALFTGHWNHLFGVGRTQTRCRILVDIANDELVAAQAFNGLKWEALSASQRADLADSLFDANDVGANPRDHGLEAVPAAPAWAVTGRSTDEAESDGQRPPAATAGKVATVVLDDQPFVRRDQVGKLEARFGVISQTEEQIMVYAIQTYGFLVPRNTRLSLSEFAERIAEVYDITAPRNADVVRVLGKHASCPAAEDLATGGESTAERDIAVADGTEPPCADAPRG